MFQYIELLDIHFNKKVIFRDVLKVLINVDGNLIETNNLPMRSIEQSNPKSFTLVFTSGESKEFSTNSWKIVSSKTNAV